MTEVNKSIEQRLTFETCREDDGDISIELYVDKSNLISMSFGGDGRISWAGIFEGKSECGKVMDPMALLVFKLLAAYAEKPE